MKKVLNNFERLLFSELRNCNINFYDSNKK